jgi:hypothetical protein
MDAMSHNPALDQEVPWPTLRMWVRGEGERVDVMSLAPARGAQAQQVLFPAPGDPGAAREDLARR